MEIERGAGADLLLIHHDPDGLGGDRKAGRHRQPGRGRGQHVDPCREPVDIPVALPLDVDSADLVPGSRLFLIAHCGCRDTCCVLLRLLSLCSLNMDVK